MAALSTWARETHAGTAKLGKAVTLCAIASVALGCSARGDARAISSEVEPLVRQEWTALKSHDATAYAALLDDDLRAVQVDGEGTRSKDQVIRQLTAQATFDYTLSRLESRALAKDFAMATYESSLQFSPPAQVRMLRVYVAEIWRKQGGSWKLLHYQETRVR
jgi:uncharacterized protein (TIGR02246 family)